MLLPAYLLPSVTILAFGLFTCTAAALPAWDLAEPEDRPPAVQSRPATSKPSATPSEEKPEWESDGSTDATSEDVPEPTPENLPIIAVPERSDVPEGDDELDTRLAVLDQYLADIQRPVRAHYFGWMAAQAGLIGMSAYLAATGEGPSRTGAMLRASISGANLGLMLITPQPGWYASSRYRKMPTDTSEQRREKLEAGQKWLARQARVDKLGTSPARHALGAIVALGAGAAVFIAHEDGLREAITTTIGILLVSELQIATRPRKPRLYNQNYASAPQGPVQLSLAPLVTQHAQGLGLVGKF